VMLGNSSSLLVVLSAQQLSEDTKLN
jgi:hypothetical protein